MSALTRPITRTPPRLGERFSCPGKARHDRADRNTQYIGNLSIREVLNIPEHKDLADMLWQLFNDRSNSVIVLTFYEDDFRGLAIAYFYVALHPIETNSRHSISPSVYDLAHTR